jgi:uncharacterized repeat protein (TIGR01451 family)
MTARRTFWRDLPFRKLAALACAAALVGCTTTEKKSDTDTESAMSDNPPMWIDLDPMTDVAPVKSKKILVARVVDRADEPVPAQRVNWMVANGSVGNIIAYGTDNWDQGGSSYWSEDDESGSARGGGNGVFASTWTSSERYVLDMGTSDTDDDVVIEPGETWIALASTMEGTTDVIAVAPGIDGLVDQSAFASTKWMDVDWTLPPETSQRIGSPHTLTTKLARYSDGSPLAGYLVNYRIVSGPAAMFLPDNGQTASVETDAQGLATVQLVQAQPMEGINVIEVELIRPENEVCCIPAELIYVGTFRRGWLAPAIDITKSAPETAMRGATFDYDISVSNGARVSARNVVVTDVLPDGIQYVSSSPSATVQGQNLSWTLGTLESEATTDISVQVRATRTGTFINSVEVNADDGLNDRDIAQTVVVAPELMIEKTAMPAVVTTCDTVQLTYEVTNLGDGPAQDVRITDVLPAGLETEDGNRRIDIAVGPLEARQTERYTVSVVPTDKGAFESMATAVGGGGLEAQSASVGVSVQEPKLEIDKEAPEMRFLGRPVEYTITVHNVGDAPAVNTTMVDTIPIGSTFESASHGGTFEGGMVTWNLGTLAADEVATVTLVVRANEIGNLANSVIAEADCASEVSARATTRVEGIPAVLLEVIDTEDPIEVGSTVTYEITVTNQGTADALGLAVTCNMPTQMDFVSGDGPSAANAQGQVVSFAPVARLAPRNELVYRLTVRANAPGDVRFAVTLTSDSLEGPVAETESTRLY